MPCISWGRRENIWSLSAFSIVTCDFTDLHHTLALHTSTDNCRAPPYLLITPLGATAGLFSGFLQFYFWFFPLNALILISKSPQHKPHPRFAPWGYRVAHSEPFAVPQNPSKVPQCHEMIGERRNEKPSVWQTLLHASLQCTAWTVSLLMCFISLLLPNLASPAKKTCQDLVAFLPLSLWTHAVFWFNEGNSAENADKRKILVQLRPLARYKWRGQWDRAGAPRRGISGDWSHARWEPRALCRGLLRTCIERNPLCVRDAQADWCNSINFSFWHFLSAVFSVRIISCMKLEKS